MSRRETTTYGGYRISYLVDGEGPVLVLLASALESAASWVEFGYFDAFRDDCRLIAIDLVGQGESVQSVDERDYSWEQIVEQVVSVLEAESVESCTMWGYANGAETALLLANRRPDLVSRLVLGGIYLAGARQTWLDRGIDHDRVISAMAEALDVGDWDGYFDLFPIDWGERARERMRTSDPAVAAASTRGDLTRPRGVVIPNVPTLTYWAADAFPGGDNSDAGLALPLESVIVPGNHGGGFMEPARIIPAVRRFLNSVS
jgi:pimeloyl-ACP methyl ester carboxylesterase